MARRRRPPRSPRLRRRRLPGPHDPPLRPGHHGRRDAVLRDVLHAAVLLRLRLVRERQKAPRAGLRRGLPLQAAHLSMGRDERPTQAPAPQAHLREAAHLRRGTRRRQGPALHAGPDRGHPRHLAPPRVHSPRRQRRRRRPTRGQEERLWRCFRRRRRRRGDAHRRPRPRLRSLRLPADRALLLLLLPRHPPRAPGPSEYPPFDRDKDDREEAV
mmetsp:Transcript_25882/g.83838  ORF Transcript_25882/g.83838 Transcript_25882/m.83838 type:complete len:214 (-) Transcript_25882:236-877(-)